MLFGPWLWFILFKDILATIVICVKWQQNGHTVTKRRSSSFSSQCHLYCQRNKTSVKKKYISPFLLRGSWNLSTGFFETSVNETIIVLNSQISVNSVNLVIVPHAQLVFNMLFDLNLKTNPEISYHFTSAFASLFFVFLVARQPALPTVRFVNAHQPVTVITPSVAMWLFCTACEELWQQLRVQVLM